MSNNLSAYRTRKGLSQADIANAVGVTQTTISLIERGGNRNGRRIFPDDLHIS